MELSGELELRRVRYDHPHAVELTARVQRFYVELYGGPDDDPMTAAEFIGPAGGFLVGYVGGEPVTMGGWSWAPDTGLGTAKIRRMYVDPVVRRRGFAHRLLGALEEDARAAGVERMVLATGRPQTAAIAMYRAAGYADIAPFGYYADSAGVVCLGKTLVPTARSTKPAGSPRSPTMSAEGARYERRPEDPDRRHPAG